MSDFGVVTFERIKEQFESVDVGSNALYQVITELIDSEQYDVARALSAEASRIYAPGDPFIVDDVTSNTAVFLEVFRRVQFTPEPEQSMRDQWRLQITSTAAYLSNFRIFILRQAL